MQHCALTPVSADERLRKIIHSVEWFQRYNIILQDRITVGVFVCLFVLSKHSATGSHLHRISGLKWTCSRFLVWVILLVNWAETLIMDALVGT